MEYGKAPDQRETVKHETQGLVADLLREPVLSVRDVDIDKSLYQRRGLRQVNETEELGKEMSFDGETRLLDQLATRVYGDSQEDIPNLNYLLGFVVRELNGLGGNTSWEEKLVMASEASEPEERLQRETWGTAQLLVELGRAGKQADEKQMRQAEKLVGHLMSVDKKPDEKGVSASEVVERVQGFVESHQQRRVSRFG